MESDEILFADQVSEFFTIIKYYSCYTSQIKENRIEKLDLKEYFIASSTLIINQFNNQFIFINRFT